jgi:hypothetical protein
MVEIMAADEREFLDFFADQYCRCDGSASC